MKKNKIWLLPILTLVFTQCSVLKQNIKTSKATIIEEGFVNCFEKGLMTKDKPTWCEASAVLYADSTLYFANDKEMPDERTSVFSTKLLNGQFSNIENTVYVQNQFVKKAIKFEEFTVAPDGKTVFLTTAFDRTKSPKSDEWDGYNSLIYWTAGHPENAKVVSENGTDSTSISIRFKIAKVLKNTEFPDEMPYFKIEGLAVTSTQVLFGIREYGKKYDKFNYAVKIISVSYEIKNGIVHLENDYEVLADIDITKIAPTIAEKVAISSIEFNKYNNNFYILTSFEDGDNIGAYLWKASWEDLKKNIMKPLLNQAGTPFKFTHKAEDLTILDKNLIFVIHDDDRVKTSVGTKVREPHQSAYSIVKIK